MKIPKRLQKGTKSDPKLSPLGTPNFAFYCTGARVSRGRSQKLQNANLRFHCYLLRIRRIPHLLISPIFLPNPTGDPQASPELPGEVQGPFLSGVWALPGLTQGAEWCYRAGETFVFLQNKRFA